MFVSYPGRSLHLLKVCLALLVIYAGFSYWRITSGYTDSGNPWTRPLPLEGGNKPPSPPAPLHNGGNSAPAPAAAEVDEDPYRGATQTVDNTAAPPPAPLPPSQPPTATEDLTSDDQTPLSLSLPAEYNSHPPTSSFCASRFTPQWFDIVRDNHQQYCLDSSASRLHCFHTPSDFHNDRHIDTFCVGQNVVYDSKREKFTLDCPVTKQVTPGLPRTPMQFHEYWYSTGPGPIFSEWVTLDDRAGLIREMKVKGPASVNNVVKGGSSAATAASSSSPQTLSKPKAIHEPDQPGRPTERDINTDTARKPQYRPRAAAPAPPPQRQEPALLTASTQQTPRTFTVLLKREGSHNIFHSLHELMSLMQTFDALRTTRDPATGRPYFVSPQDVENTQIVVLDEHPDGPYFDLWKLFSGRQPKRITEMAGLDVGKPVPRRRRRDVAGTLAAPATSENSHGGESTAVQGESQDQTWLTRPLDNLIIPLAGAANSVWHDDWEKWDCVNELRTVFVRRVLDFYGFPADEPVARLGSVSNAWGKKRDVDGDGSSDEDATSQATGDSQEDTIEKSTDGKPKTGGRRPKSGGQNLKTLSGSSTAALAKIEDAKPASSTEPPATSEEDANSNTESTGDSPATPQPATNNNEKASTPTETAIAPPKSATADPESLSPWRPGALRITFIDRKETRRVQDTAALLTHARSTLARSNLDVHIRAIDFATLSFREQIALARQTDILVGVHGAGLTHTLFMKQDMGALIEIFPEGFELRCFRAMARDRGLEYYKMHVPVVEKKEDFHGEDVIVPRDRFVEVLEHAVKALDNRPGSFRDFY